MDFIGLATLITSICTGVAVLIAAVSNALNARHVAAQAAEVKAAVARDTAKTAEVKAALVKHTEATAAKLEEMTAKVEEVKQATNGMKTELVETVKAAAFAAGVKSETDKQNGGAS